MWWAGRKGAMRRYQRKGDGKNHTRNQDLALETETRGIIKRYYQVTEKNKMHLLRVIEESARRRTIKIQ